MEMPLRRGRDRRTSLFALGGPCLGFEGLSGRTKSPLCRDEEFPCPHAAESSIVIASTVLMALIPSLTRTRQGGRVRKRRQWRAARLVRDPRSFRNRAGPAVTFGQAAQHPIARED